MGGAVHLDQWDKLVQFQGCVLLVLVAQEVGQDGLGVRQVFADRKGDGLTGGRGHCGLPLEGHKPFFVFVKKR